MQDHPTVGPVVRTARIGDRQIDRVLRKLVDRRRAEKGVNRRRCGARNVRREGDAPAPGIVRARPEQERIEDNLEAAAFQVADAPNNRRVARRAAVDIGAVRRHWKRDDARKVLFGQARDHPVGFDRRAAFDLPDLAQQIDRRWVDVAIGRVLGIEEPRADDRNRRAFGMGRLQLVHRIGIIGLRPARREIGVGGFRAEQRSRRKAMLGRDEGNRVISVFARRGEKMNAGRRRPSQYRARRLRPKWAPCFMASSIAFNIESRCSTSSIARRSPSRAPRRGHWSSDGYARRRNLRRRFRCRRRASSGRRQPRRLA